MSKRVENETFEKYTRKYFKQVHLAEGSCTLGGWSEVAYEIFECKLLSHCDAGAISRWFYDNFTHKSVAVLSKITFYFSKSRCI